LRVQGVELVLDPAGARELRVWRGEDATGGGRAAVPQPQEDDALLAAVAVRIGPLEHRLRLDIERLLRRGRDGDRVVPGLPEVDREHLLRKGVRRVVGSPHQEESEEAHRKFSGTPRLQGGIASTSYRS